MVDSENMNGIYTTSGGCCEMAIRNQSVLPLQTMRTRGMMMIENGDDNVENGDENVFHGE